jgi:hypothetical protein
MLQSIPALQVLSVAWNSQTNDAAFKRLQTLLPTRELIGLEIARF